MEKFAQRKDPRIKKTDDKPSTDDPLACSILIEKKTVLLPKKKSKHTSLSKLSIVIEPYSDKFSPLAMNEE